jgi:hypothetical protein
LEYLKDFDFQLSYHPGKANVVTDALSRMSLHMSALMVKELELIEQFQDLSLISELTPEGEVGNVEVDEQYLGRD